MNSLQGRLKKWNKRFVFRSIRLAIKVDNLKNCAQHVS